MRVQLEEQELLLREDVADEVAGYSGKLLLHKEVDAAVGMGLLRLEPLHVASTPAGCPHDGKASMLPQLAPVRICRTSSASPASNVSAQTASQLPRRALDCASGGLSRQSLERVHVGSAIQASHGATWQNSESQSVDVSVAQGASGSRWVRERAQEP